MGWTPEQQQAIDLDNKNILVSAAAGSGKTAVLVERVVSHLLRPEGSPGAWNVDQLLMVTFTKAAAAEMSDRIGRRLQQAIGEEQEKPRPDKALIRRLQRQIILLGSASISTIHSFCQSLIKNNFTALDLDPRFRVAQENELKLLQQDVLEELFESRYEQGDPVLEQLALQYSTDRGDEELYEIVLNIYKHAQNQPFPEHWLHSLVTDYLPEGRILVEGGGEAAAAKVEGERPQSLRDYPKWWKAVSQDMGHRLDKAWSILEEFRQLAEQVDDPKGYSLYKEREERSTAILTRIGQAIEKGSWKDIYEAFAVLDTGSKGAGFIDMPRNKIDVDLEHKKALVASNKALKTTVEKIRADYVQDTEEVLLADLALLSEEARGLVELVLDYGRAYAAAKKEKNIIEFNDMEHLALELLVSPDSTPEHIMPSDTALSLRQRYAQIMVDEYQDTNQVQDTIVRMLAGEEGRLFTVGDVKQSIYGFRSAEPGLFIAKYDDYKAGADSQDANPLNQLITLGRNFRSRREILSAANFVFGQLMTREAAAVEYDEDAMLNPGEPYGYLEPEEGRAMPPELSVELDILMEQGLMTQEAEEATDAADGAKERKSGAKKDTEEADDVEELKGVRLEAQYIARRLRELKASGCMVFDKHCKENNGYRPIRWRDMVILMRSVSGTAQLLQEILQANDIPVYAALDDGYFRATEIQVMTSLLSVIDNASQDIPLAAVLYSPIVGLSAEQLAKVRLSASQGDLYQAVVGANNPEAKLSAQIKNKLANFLTHLSQWRQLSRCSSVAALLWQIYQDTGYYDYVGCMPGGILRQANLRMLMGRAQEFESTNYRGLFRFLSFIDKIRRLNTDLSTARTLGENEDVVRVLSIHKSKGLEFPVVVVANMGKKFNTLDLKKSVLVHKQQGLGLKVIDLEKSVSYPSFASMAVKTAMHSDLLAEEMRILYVAMTRAREKLIMTGRVKDGCKAVQNWCSYREYHEEGRPGMPEPEQERVLRQPLPSYAVHGVDTYLDWVAMAVARHQDGRAFAPLLGLSEDQYVQSLGYSHSMMGSEGHWHISLVPAEGINLPQGAEGEVAQMISAVIARESLAADEQWSQRVARALDWRYDYRGTQEVPSKLSVSELKRRFAQELQDRPDALPGQSGQTGMGRMEGAVNNSLDSLHSPNSLQNALGTFAKPGFIQRREEADRAAASGEETTEQTGAATVQPAAGSKSFREKLGGAEYGTLMHSVMQHLDLSGDLSRAGIYRQLQSMVAREILTEDQASIVSTKNIASFWASDLGQRMLGASQVWREMPFCRMLKAQEYYQEVTDPEAMIFNQGVIDALFQEADGRLVLVDYKTDRDTRPEAVRQKYAIQLRLYSQAVQSIIGRQPDECCLYMLRDGSSVEIEMED